MTTRSLLNATIGIVTAVMLTACQGTNIEGRWVEPVPGMEHMLQGMALEAGGKASSVNMATLRYETWKKSGNTLILTGQDVYKRQVTERSLVTTCRLVNTSRSDNNPQGFMVENLLIIENKDLQTYDR